MIVFLPTTALAHTSSPPYETPTIFGYKYSFTSEVDLRGSIPPTVEAVATVKVLENQAVPTGYMGANARLYNSSGALQASSGPVYNVGTTSMFFVYSPRISTPGQYYAHNIGLFYNGNGYNTYIGYESPIQTLSRSSSESKTDAPKVIEELIAQEAYAVNENGETYGSSLSAYTIGVEPDLISAVSTNGVNGYVRADELTPKVSTIEEALKLMGKKGDVRTIPIYDADGKTVLGEFEMVTNYELVKETE